MNQPRTGRQGRLDRAAAERVLRRAVELGDEPGDHDDEFQLDVLVAAAADLGVPATAVHRAVAEEQSGLLVAGARMDVLVGPSAISSARVVDLPVDAAMALTDEWLRKAWAFKRTRSNDLVADYRRRTDVVASLQRSARSMTGRESGDKVRRVRVLVRSIAPQQSIVALVVDLETTRTMAEAGGAAVTGTGSLMAAVSALTWAPWAWLGVPASAAMGAGVMLGHRQWTHGISNELDDILERIVAHESPDSVMGSLAGGLTGRFRRG